MASVVNRFASRLSFCELEASSACAEDASIRQVRSQAALGGQGGEAAVGGGDLLGELGQGVFAGGAVDADTLPFALVGALSGQLSPHRDGGSALAEIDTFRLINQGASLYGYSGTDHPEVKEEWAKRFGDWLRSGEITFPHVRIPGIDQAPRALQELFEGRHFGTVVVELPPR